jgi:hypothetical protein
LKQNETKTNNETNNETKNETKMKQKLPRISVPGVRFGSQLEGYPLLSSKLVDYFSRSAPAATNPKVYALL